jgi:tetratricopeptide (TPR) repeat protein
MHEAIATGEVNAASRAADFLAREFLAAGLPEEALPFLEIAATGTDPDVAMGARYNRAVLHRRAGRRAQAYDDYRAVTESGTPARQKAQLGLGSFLAEEGRVREAVEELRRASEGQSGDIAAMAELGLGDIAAALGDVETAAAYHRRAAARESET